MYLYINRLTVSRTPLSTSSCTASTFSSPRRRSPAGSCGFGLVWSVGVRRGRECFHVGVCTRWRRRELVSFALSLLVARPPFRLARDAACDYHSPSSRLLVWRPFPPSAGLILKMGLPISESLVMLTAG